MFDDIIGEKEKKFDGEIIQIFNNDEEEEDGTYCTDYPKSCEGCEKMCSHAWMKSNIGCTGNCENCMHQCW